MQFTATVDEVTDDNCVIVKTDTRPNDSHRSKKMSDTNSAWMHMIRASILITSFQVMLSSLYANETLRAKIL